MSATQPQVQVLVDWTNNPIGYYANAGANFVDISSYVRLDSDLNMSRGRQDNISAVQPARCSFTVDNSSGRFTPGNSASPYYPGVTIGRRIQVNVKDEAGTYHTRFDGMIAEIDVNDSATGQDTTALIICTDVLAFLARYPGMSSWTVEQTAFFGPMVQYVLSEDSSAPGVSDAQGNGPTLPLYVYQQPQAAPSNSGKYQVTGATATYQSGNGPVEGAVAPNTWTSLTTPLQSAFSSPVPSVEFGATVGSSGSGAAVWGPSAQFQGNLPEPVTAASGNAYTIVAWAWPNVAASNIWECGYSQFIATLGNTRTGSMVGLYANTSGTSGSFGYYGASYYSNILAYGNTPSSTGHLGSTNWFNGPVMVALVINGTTGTFYVGGNLYTLGNTLLTATGTLTIPSGTVFNSLTIGGPLGGGNGFIGNVSNVCVYDSALSTAALNQFAQVGAYGPGLWTVGQDIGFLLEFTGTPPYWTGQLDYGGIVPDWFDLTNTGPVDAANTLQQADLGLLFTDATGKVNYHSRGRRMGAPAPSVTLPAGSYNPGIAPKWNDQYLNNSAAVQSTRGGTPTVAQNATSIAQYGTYANGTIASPNQIPLYNYLGGFEQHQVFSPATWQAVNVFDPTPFEDAAAWPVNTASQPGMKLATIAVDLVSNQPGHNEYIAPSALYTIEIDSVISLGENLPWWPNSAEVSELFIEGVSETYSTTQGFVQFYTSPAYTGRGWVPGNATYGKLDVSARVGAFNGYGAINSPLVAPSPPTFSATMNNTDAGVTTNGYVSANNVRAISSNLQLGLQPPLLYTQQTQATQSIPTSANTFIVWDGTMLDTSNQMNQYTNGANAVVIWQQGWYEVCLTVAFGANATGDRRIWICQNQTNALRQVAPAQTKGYSPGATALSTSAVIWCNSGDAIACLSWQDSGAALSTSIANGGSHMSLRYLGAGTNQN